jgi:2-hydroxy-3-keto-5-methylthiopentenyl-1-phosphate phosphatase
VAILSDNFHFIIDTILKNIGIGHIPVYANSLDFDHARLNPSFPHINRNCWKCAHCKTKNLLANIKRDSIIIYIGDGRSDICPAGYADIVFAKEELLDYYRNKKMMCLAYKSLKDVYEYFKRSFA